MKPGIALIICFFVPTVGRSFDTDSHIVVEPANNATDKPEKMLLFIPGGAVPNHHYIETAKAIQAAATELKLWVVIPAVFQRLCIIECTIPSLCAPLHYTVEAALSLAKDMGWKRGTDEQDLWLAGHSLGGVCANTLFRAYYSNSTAAYAGLVVMGSYVDETGDYDLIHYPKPAFILNVELDGGLARPGKTSIWWRQYLNMQQPLGKENTPLDKVVVILPSLNHSNFCPGFDVKGDLPAEVDQATALREIGQTFAAFLHVQTSTVPEPPRLASEKVLLDKVNWTRGFLSPYLKAQDMERTAKDVSVSSEGASPFCARAQRLIAGLSEADDDRLVVADGFHITQANLEHCHPNGTMMQDLRLHVRSCSHTDYYSDIAELGSITAASEISCKMLTSDNIARLLHATAANSTVDCKAVNRHAVELAEALAAPSTLARYRRAGRGWCFLDDVPVVAGPLWVFASPLKETDTGNCLAVASPAMKVPLDFWIYPGNHYCKLLSPARVLDWMMTDSLKPSKAVQSPLAGLVV